MDSQAKQLATHEVHARILREFYTGHSVFVKELRKEDTWWPGSMAERSGPRSYVVVLNDKRVWKRHVDHVRRDSMDRAVSDPSCEMEAQDKPPELPFHLVCVFQTRHRHDQLGQQMYVAKWSRERQAQEEVPATAIGEVLPIVTQSPEAVCLPFRRFSRVRKAPDRLIETKKSSIGDFESISKLVAIWLFT